MVGVHVVNVEDMVDDTPFLPHPTPSGVTGANQRPGPVTQSCDTLTPLPLKTAAKSTC